MKKSSPYLLAFLCICTISLIVNVSNSFPKPIPEPVGFHLDRLPKAIDVLKHALSATIPFDLDIQQRYPLRSVACYDAGYPILMHGLPIIDWVCDEKSEKMVTVVMMRVFRQYSDRGIVGKMLDVGANAGYFGLLAAKHGHDVVFFDLQPECQTILHNSILVNGFSGHAHVVAAGVSDVKSSIKVPSDGCNGRFPAEAYETEAFTNYNLSAQLYPLTEFISHQEIMMMKVDTEGNEKRVLQGAMEFFRRNDIRHAIVEVTPGFGFWENSGILREEVIDALSLLIEHGYVGITLTDWTVLNSRDSISKYPLIRNGAGQFDVWFTIDPDVIKAVDNRTVVDQTIVEF